ncbi:MAG: hypothetical protein ACRD3E_11425 [Terriglobales bacterium]
MQRDTDLFVTDYFPDQILLSAEFRALLVEPTWLMKYRNELDWRLVHVTLFRLNFEQNPVWQPEKVFAHVEQLIVRFLGALPSHLRPLFDPYRQ